jgi:hypothetical protein
MQEEEGGEWERWEMIAFGVGGGFPAEMLTNFATIGEGFAWFLGGSLASRLRQSGHFLGGELRVCQGCRIGLPTRTSAFPGGSFDFRWGILKLWWAVGVW